MTKEGEQKCVVPSKLSKDAEDNANNIYKAITTAVAQKAFFDV